MNEGGKLVLRRTKPKVLKVVRNFFALERVLMVKEKPQQSAKRYYIWEIPPFLDMPSYRNMQDHCK